MRLPKLLVAVVVVLLASLCAVILYLLVEEARHARSMRQRTDSNRPSAVL